MLSLPTCVEHPQIERKFLRTILTYTLWRTMPLSRWLRHFKRMNGSLGQEAHLLHQPDPIGFLPQLGRFAVGGHPI